MNAGRTEDIGSPDRERVLEVMARMTAAADIAPSGSI
jgi:hypothetical protein